MKSLSNRMGYQAVITITGLLFFSTYARAQFASGNLLVSRTVYSGTASTIVIGQPLPGGGTAVADGSFPGVWQNEGPDPSFGLTSPIFIDQITTGGSHVSSVAIDPMQIVTSFSSKSELALNLSTDGHYVTFMGYVAPVNALDVSNSNSPNHFDPTNPVGLTYPRAVAQLDAYGNMQVTPVNTYSGNNGRAAILATNVNGSGQNSYYTVGNAGNGSGAEPVNIVNNTGVQIATPGGSASTTVVGTEQGVPGSANGFQYGYSVTQNGAPADKSGKDDNFRGETIFNNTLYVSKGSGGNGVNTVYQVGLAGSLPTTASAATTEINILPGFPMSLAKNAGAMNPFGLWFANSTTLYVADEGDGTLADLNNGKNPNSGLQKWSLLGGVWQLDYTLQLGLNLGLAYSVAGYSGPNPATDGLRSLAGEVNNDGTVTLFATTSTVSANTDPGADPNKLVSITDDLAFLTLSAANNEQFQTLETAGNGEVLRGVSLVPSAVPEPSTYSVVFGMISLGLIAAKINWRGGLQEPARALLRWARRKNARD